MKIEGNNEFEPAESSEFPALTAEDFKEIKHLSLELFDVFSGSHQVMKGFRKYTDTTDELGAGGIYENSIDTSGQLQFAMAMTRHQLVKDLVNDKAFNPKEFNPDKFIDAKIMKGMKILDLGCGHSPIFARVARAMGATAWTVDKLTLLEGGPQFLRHRKTNLTEEQIETELVHHIELDLEDGDAVERIRQISGGNFDLVTESRLFYDDVEEMAMQLLKKGGIFNSEGEFQLLNVQSSYPLRLSHRRDDSGDF